MLSIVIPTYHEAANIRPLVRRIHSSLYPTEIPYEVILVDDDSRDGIEEAVHELEQEALPVRLIVRRDERGLSSAVLRGFREARGDILLCMDADLSHPPEKIPSLVRCFDDPDCDMAIGSRYVLGGGAEEDWGWFRRLNSRVATMLARPLSPAKDPMAGFFALPRKVVDRAEALNPLGFKIGLELLVKCRCRSIREVPIVFAQRHQGRSKMGLREQLRYLMHLKRLADFRYGAASRFVQFCMVGSTGMVVDLTLYALLLGLGLGLHAARGLAIFAALNWNFVGNRSVTFAPYRASFWPGQYLGFVASSLLGAFLSWLVSTTVAPRWSFFEDHLILAAMAGIAAGALSNFLISQRFVFRYPWGWADSPQPSRTSTPTETRRDGVYPEAGRIREIRTPAKRAAEDSRKEAR